MDNNETVGRASRPSENSSPPQIDTTWRRHLPHVQLSAGYYFITFATHRRTRAGETHALLPFQKDIVYDAIRFWDNKKYELLAFVVMDDHVHMLINPAEPLPKIMHSIKSFTAHEINKASNRQSKFWQDENYDGVIRDENEFLEKLNYIVNNPIKANLSSKYEDYKWLYIKGWINGNP